MGTKIYRLFEYGYVLMAIFSVYLVIDNWETNRNRAYLFVLFTIVAIFMYFFKRNFRRRMEDRKKDN